MTRDEVAKLLAMLHVAWPNAPSADAAAQVRAYHLALADVPYPAGEAAVAAWLKTGRFFPAPAELRELAAQALGVAPAVDQAWAEVATAIRSIGSYGQPRFSHPLIAEVVHRIGWRALCASETPAADREWFGRLYQAYRTRLLREADLAAVAQRIGSRQPAALPPERGYRPLGSPVAVQPRPAWWEDA